MFRFNNDTEKYFADSISAIKQYLVDADRLAVVLKESLEEEAYVESKVASGQMRMKLVMLLQLLDKVSVSISKEIRVEGFSGYKPIDYADVKKSSSNNLVSKILEDKRNAKRIVESLKPKEAKNQ